MGETKDNKTASNDYYPPTQQATDAPQPNAAVAELQSYPSTSYEPPEERRRRPNIQSLYERALYEPPRNNRRKHRPTNSAKKTTAANANARSKRKEKLPAKTKARKSAASRGRTPLKPKRMPA